MTDARLLVGKYRGVVVDNADPTHIGRVRARVPGALGDNVSGWALPCSPYGGKGVGFFMIPPVDALVWIEFEQGDPDYPVWSGCFWSETDAATPTGSPDVKIIKTQTATLTIDDSPGRAGITIETATGFKLVFDSAGIEITNGQSKVKLSGPSVNINDALEVM